MWMTKLTPVTTRSITTVSGSSVNPTSSLKDPEATQRKRMTSSAPACTPAIQSATEAAKEPRIAAEAIGPVAFLRNLGPSRPLTAKARSGNSGISQGVSLIGPLRSLVQRPLDSPAKPVEAIDVEDSPGSAEGDEYGQAYGRLGRGDRERHQHQDVAAHVLEGRRERPHGEVHALQH